MTTQKTISAPVELSCLSRERDNYVNNLARKKNVQHARRIMKKILSREVGQGTCQGVVILHREVRKKNSAEKVNFERMKDEGQVRRLSVGVMRGGI